MVRRIKQAAVIGSGVMGSGIAALLADAGVDTLLLDIVPFDLSEEEKKDPEARNRIVKAGFENLLHSRTPVLMHPDNAARIRIGNLEDDFSKLSECDWIVEVVVENLAVKQELLKRIEKVRKPDSIVTTNTSGIPLKAMSEGLSSDFRGHFMGTHFFNPVRYMHLLELIPGEETLPEVKAFMADYGERILGKGIVWAKDTPNFIGNRIGVYVTQRATHSLVEHGLRIEEADAVLGPVLGRPKTAIFKTMDLVGLDTMGHVLKNTYDGVPHDEERELFTAVDFVSRMIEKKMFGNKTGGGFYKKQKDPNGGRVQLVINPQTGDYEPSLSPDFPCLAEAKKAAALPGKMRAVLNGTDKGAAYAWKVTAGFLLYSANRIPEIADSIVEIDNAMKWGYNYQMGPFECWDAIGLADTVSRMEREGMAVPRHVKEMLANGHDSFYKSQDGKTLYYDFASGAYQVMAVNEKAVSLRNLKNAGRVVKTCPSASLIDLGDGVFCCEFHTKMNTLNGELVDFLHEALDYVDKNGIGLVIGNQPEGSAAAFSAGANLMEVASVAKEGRWDVISHMVQRLQDAVQKTRYAAFPVVAAPYGLALGGGCEVGLGADRMVAHAELYTGLVEAGVGLLPSGGGCMNLLKKFIHTMPSCVKDVDLMPYLLPLFTQITTAKVSTSAADARANGFLSATDRIVFNRDLLIGEAKAEVLKMVADGYAPPLKKKIKVPGAPAQKAISSYLADLLKNGRISDYDSFIATRIAYVLSGGDAPAGAEVEEEVILGLEKAAFLDLLKQQKTGERIAHMLKTGKPLRN